MKRSETYGWLAHWLLAENLEAPPEGFNWDRAIDAASHHFATPGLARKLEGQPWVPVQTAEYLAAVLFLNRERNRQLAAGLEQVCAWLCDAGLVPLLIKGASLLATGMLRDPGERLIGDLDILLPDEAQLQAARKVLAAQGFRFLAENERDDHQLGMAEHPVDGYGVELHRRIIAQCYATALDAELIMQRAAIVQLGQAQVRVPLPEDRLAIAMAHAQTHDRGREFDIIGLRLLQDIAMHRAMPGGEVHWVKAMTTMTGRDAPTYAPIEELVEGASISPRGLTAVMASALDNQWKQRVRSGRQMLETLPRLKAMSWAERREALTPARWRARVSYFFRRW